MESLRATRFGRAGHVSTGAWLFLAIVTSLALAPLVLQVAFPAHHLSGRNIGRPLSGLTELALWGFGGALPESLAPITNEESARGVGHLPREITVPMGTLLTAAWIWISFSALALVGRLVPSPRARRSFLLTSPTLLGIACYFSADGEHASSAWFDPRFFWPLACEDSGIWRSDPVVLRSFGPVLLIALLCVLVVRITEHFERRVPHAARAPDASGLVDQASTTGTR